MLDRDCWEQNLNWIRMGTIGARKDDSGWGQQEARKEKVPIRMRRGAAEEDLREDGAIFFGILMNKKQKRLPQNVN